MTTDVTFDASRPVDDRYTVPACGELAEIDRVFRGRLLSGGARVLPEYEGALAHWFGAARALAVNSGTSALHASLACLGVGHGDEVLVPATAPIVTAMPILTCGATPVIVDTMPLSLAMDPTDVTTKLSLRTKAALSLPLWGYPVDDSAAAQSLAAAGVPIVEDACQAHGTKLRGRYAGTLHRVGCLSTHDRKPLPTGEGGLILTDDDELAERIDHFTHLGHLTGNTHGVNLRLAGPLAAIGLRRLDQLSEQLAARGANATRLLDALPEGGRLSELSYGPDGEPNYYTLVLVASAEAADNIAANFAEAGLPPDSIRFGYRPLYRQPIFARYETAGPNAEALCARTIQLPVHPGMSDTELQWVADHIRAIAEGQHA